jgi:hypothetical protein
MSVVAFDPILLAIESHNPQARLDGLNRLIELARDSGEDDRAARLYGFSSFPALVLQRERLAARLRSRRYLQQQAERGRVSVTVLVPVAAREQIRALAKKLREEA